MLPVSSFDLNGPAGESALVQAVAWVRDLLLGSLGQSVAVMAIAAVGFLALQGRLDVRRVAATVLGCFILFGAPIIAAGLFRIGTGAPVEQAQTAPPPPMLAPEPPRAVAPPLPSPPSVYDPYAGAAVPRK